MSILLLQTGEILCFLSVSGTGFLNTLISKLLPFLSSPYFLKLFLFNRIIKIQQLTSRREWLINS